MSKFLDALENKNTRKQVSGLGIHDELARTYFQAPHKPGKDKAKWPAFIPWLITAAVILIAITVVLTRSSIDIKVRLLGEVPAFSGPSAEKGIERGEFLVKGGQPQTTLVKNVYFAGDGKAFSGVQDEEMILCNARGSGWANYTIELKEPVDLNKLDIKYTARGARGDEYLVLVVMDSSNRIYRMEKDLSSAVSNEWKRYTVSFRPAKKILDLANIAVIKFEFGSLTAGNYSTAVIHLKDVCLTKARRLKWQ